MRLTQLLVALAALSSAAAARRLLDESRVRPVLSRVMACYNISTLRVAVVQAGAQPQTLRLRLNAAGSVEDISHDDEKLLIGSVSKGMFGTALPRIEQRLRQQRPQLSLLTTPLKQLLGDDFWFLDHGRTEQVTLQDLVSHTAGLDRHDLIWLLRGFRNLDDLAKHGSRLSARQQFRSSFVYNNVAFSVADAALRRLTNQTFAQYMRHHLWQPLGMRGAVAASEMNFPDDDLRKSLELVEAAGGIGLPLDDMVKYMEYHVANYNYSNVAPLPKYFSPVNAQLGQAGGALFSHFLLQDNVTNLPDIGFHSYGYGWMKTHYRDRLSYFHNGAYFQYRAELDVFVKQNLAVFTYADLNASDTNVQSLYVSLLHKYVADMLLLNDSFVNEGNACSLMRPLPQPPLAVLRIRQLSDRDVSVCSGTYGHYGFGTVRVAKDASSGDLLARYGAATMRLIPLQRQAPSTAYEFFVILDYLSVSNAMLVVGRNSSHITVSGSPGPSMATIASSGGSVSLTMPLLEAGLVLRKGLDPDTWQRPQLCEPRAAAAPAAAAWLQLTAAAAVAMVTGASLR